jgi:hypothetical protein
MVHGGLCRPSRIKNEAGPMAFLLHNGMVTPLSVLFRSINTIYCPNQCSERRPS